MLTRNDRALGWSSGFEGRAWASDRQGFSAQGKHNSTYSPGSPRSPARVFSRLIGKANPSPFFLAKKFGAENAPLIRSLMREKDPEMLLVGLLQLGQILEGQGRNQAAAEVYSALILEVRWGPTTTREMESLAHRAQSRLNTLNGRGNFGEETERFLGNFVETATDYRLIVPMVAGSWVYQVTRASALSRLLASPAGNWFTRGWGARLAGGAIGFTVEVPAFALSSQALYRLKGDSANSIGFGGDLFETSFTLGAFKLSAWAGTKLAGSPLLANLPSKPGSIAKFQGAFHSVAVPGMGLFLVPGLESSENLSHTLGMLAGLLVGSHLGSRLTGGAIPQFRERPAAKKFLSEDFPPGNRYLAPYPVGEGAPSAFPSTGKAPQPPHILLMTHHALHAQTPQEKLRLEARKRVVLTFGQPKLPTTHHIPGVSRQLEKTFINNWLMGKPIQQEKYPLAKKYGQIKALLTGLGMATEKVHPLILDAVFEERGWEHRTHTAAQRLLFATRSAMALRHGGAFTENPFREKMENPVGWDLDFSNRYLRGEPFPYSEDFGPQEKYRQIRALMDELAMDPPEIDYLIGEAVREEIRTFPAMGLPEFLQDLKWLASETAGKVGRFGEWAREPFRIPDRFLEENDPLLRQKLEAALMELSPQEQQVLERRYGFRGEESLPYEKIAREMNLSLQRIRQIEKTAIEKLQKNIRLRRFYFGIIPKPFQGPVRKNLGDLQLPASLSDRLEWNRAPVKTIGDLLRLTEWDLQWNYGLNAEEITQITTALKIKYNLRLPRDEELTPGQLQARKVKIKLREKEEF